MFSTAPAIIKINRFPLRHAREYSKLDWKLKILYSIALYTVSNNCVGELLFSLGIEVLICSGIKRITAIDLGVKPLFY